MLGRQPFEVVGLYDALEILRSPRSVLRILAGALARDEEACARVRANVPPGFLLPRAPQRAAAGTNASATAGAPALRKKKHVMRMRFLVSFCIHHFDREFRGCCGT